MKEQDAVGRIFGFAGFPKMLAQEQPIVGQLQKRVDSSEGSFGQDTKHNPVILSEIFSSDS